MTDEEKLEPDFLIAEESHPVTKEGTERALRYLAKPSTTESLAFWRNIGLGWIKPR